MQIKTSLQKNKSFKTIPAGRRIVAPTYEHNKHVSYWLFSHLAAREFDF